MTHVRIEVDEATLKKLVMQYLTNLLGTINLDEKHLNIEVKTTQNYRTAEWEKGRYRAIYDKSGFSEEELSQ